LKNLSGSLVKSPDRTFFKPASWILFLNKSDLMKASILKDPLSNYFADFPEDDAQSYEKSCDYVKQRYEEAFKGTKLFTFITCALDTQNCQRVFSAVKETVITQALEQAGFHKTI